MGNTKNLKQAQLVALQKLLDENFSIHELISLPLLQKLSKACLSCHRMIGLLIDRKSKVRFVVAGEATRLYLPDIGRTRGAKNRLRGLRLIVARPNPLNFIKSATSGSFTPTLADDFRTDLEKLRLDAVIEFEAHRDGSFPVMVLAYLYVESSPNGLKRLMIRQSLIDSGSKLNLLSITNLVKEVEDELLDIGSNNLSIKKSARGAALERAILVGVYSGSKKEGLFSMLELSELARSAHVEVADKITQWRKNFDPRTVVGSGKLEDICLHALSLGVQLIIFDQDLTPSQLNYITDLTDLRVLDRTMLILDIFSQRAKTKEGKLQVEMAQLIYSLPRLSKKQSGLSRLTGGIGGRGPGETKLEVDKRRVRDRIARVTGELSLIKSQRALRRKIRKNSNIPTLAIVGYTNAGKSTLLNSLSGSEVYTKDELFATLDPHSRRLRFPRDLDVLITDTVGFIKDLPKSLMKAFLATLEELYEADVLIQVIDISDENFRSHIKAVDGILSELGISDKPKILVFNKIDLLDPQTLKERVHDFSNPVLVSAQKMLGLKELIEKCQGQIL